MVVGHGTREGVTIGPLIDDRAVDKADEHVQDAIAHGARLVIGGERLTSGEYDARLVLRADRARGRHPGDADLAPRRRSARSPASPASRPRRRRSGSPTTPSTGSRAYFHTRDYARLLRVAEKLEYGIVGANAGIISAANAPFGGVKESGYGREGGAFGIDEYLDVKYVLRRRRRHLSDLDLPASRATDATGVGSGCVYPDAVALFSRKPRRARSRATFAASAGRCSICARDGSASSAASRSRCTVATTSTRRWSSSAAPSSSRSRRG